MCVCVCVTESSALHLYIKIKAAASSELWSNRVGVLYVFLAGCATICIFPAIFVVLLKCV